MSGKSKIFGDFISVIFITVLFLVILVLVVFSASSYRKSVDIQEENNNTRAVLSYVTTAVQASRGNSISLEDREGIQVLAIEEGDSGYEQQIFWMDGKVLEAYVPSGTIPAEKDALTVGYAKEFAMSYVKDDLLEVRSELGASYVHIR